MLAPDVKTSEDNLAGSSHSMQTITQYAQATVTLVPAYTDPLKSQFPKLEKDLQTPIADAKHWLAQLCPTCSQTAPKVFCDYEAQFDKHFNELNTLVTALKANPDDNASKQRLVNVLSSLQAELKAGATPLDALHTKLADFRNDLIADNRCLETTLQTISTEIHQGSQIIDNVKAALATNFLDNQQLGPCTAIVTIKASVSIKIQSAGGSQPAVIPLVMAQALFNNLSSSNNDALKAAAALTNGWQTLIAQYEQLITQINNAKASELGGILQSLYIDAARADWQQIAEFAHGLINDAVPA